LYAAGRKVPNFRTLKLRIFGPDYPSMGRSAIGLGAVLGGTVGSYVPVVLWGASSFGVASLLFGALGSVAGVLLGARLSEV
jgi:hypothetical protein